MYGSYFNAEGYHLLHGGIFANREDAFTYLKSGKDMRPFDDDEANEELDEMERSYNDPNDIIAHFRREGAENIRIFAQMRRFSTLIPEMGIALCGSDDTNWVECGIDEQRYPLHEGYRITLKPIEPYNMYYASDNYYQCDFESLYKDRWFILKTDENQHVEYVKWFDEIPGTAARIVHEAYMVV